MTLNQGAGTGSWKCFAGPDICNACSHPAPAKSFDDEESAENRCRPAGLQGQHAAHPNATPTPQALAAPSLQLDAHHTLLERTSDTHTHTHMPAPSMHHADELSLAGGRTYTEHMPTATPAHAHARHAPC